MKITFKVDHKPDGQAEDRPHYRAGETYEFKGRVAETYAEKYVRRGWAVPAPERSPIAAPPAEPNPEETPALENVATDPAPGDETTATAETEADET
ncbi:MAG: hypothetical protein AB7P16_29105, partial [Bradyrhizobium sp.]